MRRPNVRLWAEILPVVRDFPGKQTGTVPGRDLARRQHVLVAGGRLMIPLRSRIAFRSSGWWIREFTPTLFG